VTFAAFSTTAFKDVLVQQIEEVEWMGFGFQNRTVCKGINPFSSFFFNLDIRAKAQHLKGMAYARAFCIQYAGEFVYGSGFFFEQVNDLKAQIVGKRVQAERIRFFEHKGILYGKAFKRLCEKNFTYFQFLRQKF
jgi:hypothetical protein